MKISFPRHKKKFNLIQINAISIYIYILRRYYTYKIIILRRANSSRIMKQLRKTPAVSLSPSLCHSLIIDDDVHDKLRNFGQL